MSKSILLSFGFVFLSLVSLSQTNSSVLKECRISTGVGFGSATENLKSVGTDFWLQLDYKVIENFSLATEFEYMTYKQDGYYNNLPEEPNEINVFNNNFSVLIKYHLPSKGKLKIMLASGWTFSIRQNDYFIYVNDGTTQSWFPNVTSFSDYRIPFLVELQYPINQSINIGARGKYDLNQHNGDTYAAGIGLSLKL